MSSDSRGFVVPQNQLLDPRFLRVFASAEILSKEPGAQHRYSFRGARFAIYQALRCLDTPRHAEVLLPAYICSSVVDAVLAYGAKPTFYSVGLDLQPVWADLERRVGPATKALLVVHYFGFPQDIEALRDFCDRHGICLVEDCAHLPGGEKNGRPLGSFGDASVFSWQKIYPIFDGGELILNRCAHEFVRSPVRRDLRYLLKSAYALAEEASRWSRFPVSRWFFAAIERSRRALLPRSGKGTQGRTPEGSDRLEPFSIKEADIPMSPVSRWIISHSDATAITRARRANYEWLCRELSELPGVRVPIPHLPDHACPWVFPLIIEAVQEPDRVLRSAGIPVMSWRGIRHPILPKGVFADADFLYEQQVFLPVHQSLREPDLIKIKAALRRVFGLQSGTPSRADQ